MPLEYASIDIKTIYMSATNKVVHTALRFAGNIVKDPFRPVGSRFSYVKRWMRLNYCWVNRRPNIPTYLAASMIPRIASMEMPLEITFRDWNITPLELYYICCFAKSLNPKQIFEFGTFDGTTALHLARVCPQAEVHTLDLPNPENHYQVGSRFLGKQDAARIHQIRADSRTHDFSGYFGRMEFIFVDAGHDYDCVAADSRNALRMVGPNATILWHDYLSFRGVKQAVDEVAATHPVVHLAGTELAVLQIGAHRTRIDVAGSTNTLLNDQLGSWLSDD